MSINFSVGEIFQMAERIERNGMNFYRRAAKGAVEKSASQLFLRLASMEEEHEKTFARMRTELTEEEKRAPGPDPDHQTAAYLRAWADGHVFDIRSNPAERLTGSEKIDDVFQMAMGMEKDSIVFYLGMKETIPEKLGRGKIDRIIKEEMGHLASLSRELETLRHQLM
jgi:rubrerythrin